MVRFITRCVAAAAPRFGHGRICAPARVAILALCIALSITAAELSIATLGFAIGVDGDIRRAGSAIRRGLISIVGLCGGLRIGACGF
jgi:hypothetical protein